MKIAIINSNPDEAFASGLEKACSIIKEAKEKGAEIAIFGNHFLNIENNPEKSSEVIDRLKESARENSINILTGRANFSDQDNIYSAVSYIDNFGEIAGWQPAINLKDSDYKISTGQEIKCIDTILDKTAVLSDLDVFDPVINKQIDTIDCKTLVMQVNPISLLEQEALRELAIGRSMSQANLVLLISHSTAQGSLMSFKTGSYVVYQGAEIAEDVGQGDLFLFELNPEYLSEYKLALQKVEIPELLKQKFSQEQIKSIK